MGDDREDDAFPAFPFLDVIAQSSTAYHPVARPPNSGFGEAMQRQHVEVPALNDIGISKKSEGEDALYLPNGRPRPSFRPRLRETFTTSLDGLLPRPQPNPDRPSAVAPLWCNVGSRSDVAFHGLEHLPRVEAKTDTMGVFTKVRQNTRDGVDCLPGTLGLPEDGGTHGAKAARARRWTRGKYGQRDGKEAEATAVYLSTPSGHRRAPVRAAYSRRGARALSRAKSRGSKTAAAPSTDSLHTAEKGFGPVWRAPPPSADESTPVFAPQQSPFAQSGTSDAAFPLRIAATRASRRGRASTPLLSVQRKVLKSAVSTDRTLWHSNTSVLASTPKLRSDDSLQSALRARQRMQMLLNDTR